MHKQYKSILTLAPTAALLLLAATSHVQAATNGQITITANVVAATCDVTLSTNNLDLGNYTPSQFISVAQPITSSVKNFTVGLSNCDVPMAPGHTANLVVSGPTLGGNPNIFNASGTNTGIMLNQVATPSAHISTGQKLQLAVAGATPSAADFNNKVLTMQAGLAATSTTGISTGSVSAPILFSFAYN